MLQLLVPHRRGQIKAPQEGGPWVSGSSRSQCCHTCSVEMGACVCSLEEAQPWGQGRLLTRWVISALALFSHF